MNVRSLLVVAVVSCGHPAPSTTRSPAVTETPARVPSPPVPTSHPPRSIVEGPPAGAIVTVATTTDGMSALTVDEIGGVLLWPTFDGTVEPRVVELSTRPRAIALLRRSAGFTAVALDEVGGLYLARIDDGGRTDTHVTVPGDPPVAGIVASARGLLAWRSDERVLLLDDDGRVLGDLPAEARQHVAAVAATGDRAVALVETETGTRARWLVLAPRLAWGAWADAPAARDRGATLALAPDGKRIAIVTHREDTADVVVAEGGRVLATAHVHRARVTAAFVSDALLALASDDGAEWLDVGAHARPVAMANAGAGLALAAGQGVAIRGLGSQLALSTPETTSYLGYALVEPLVADAARDDGLLVWGAPQLVLLDAELREDRSKTLVPASFNVGDAAWLGGDDYLVAYNEHDGPYRLALVDAATGARTIVRETIAGESEISYEPTTQLVTLSFGAQAEVARLDRKARTLRRLTPVRPNNWSDRGYAPVDPRRAAGVRVVQINMVPQVTAAWFKGTPGRTRPVATQEMVGHYLATDVTGRVFTWTRTREGPSVILAYHPDGHVDELPDAMEVAPSRDGATVAMTSDRGILVHGASGSVWERALTLVYQVQWTSSGALAITGPAGIARLDASTGRVQAARCGWSFGRSAQPLPATRAFPSLCAQLMH